ncbi:MAG: VOC family protein [Ilumatobacter sp.]|uniref:VOC family protein n=1 Tax=Ilumatobacter sp. TaxID=1967498 RepID=UPI0026247BEC|nr:VOC family protein [Ilumatobacter sp.]MDJ0768451.1 VOC family protein [Ilumatobacter sp.]
MKLGAFSISLAVADLGASQTFYEALGFEQIGGNADENWLIMRNGDAVIGLFHGMFEQNILTFNPGLTQRADPTDDFTDVREIQSILDSAGIELAVRTDPDATGAGHIVLTDPDGNPVMVDQFASGGDD